MTSTSNTRHRIFGLLIVLGMLMTGCGSAESASESDRAGLREVDASDDDVAIATEDSESSADQARTSADAGEPDSEGEQVEGDAATNAEEDSDPVAPEPEPPAVLELNPADWDGLVEWSLPALGGLRFGTPQGLVVHHDADMVTIRQEFALDRGRYEPTMVVARVHHAGTGVPLDVEGFTSSAIAGVGSAEPTNTTLPLFDEQLQGWRFTADDGQALGPHYLYSAYPEGGNGPTAWQPFPHAEIYLADVPGGVVAVGWIGQDEAALREARAIFDVVAPTLTLAQPFDESAGPIAPLDLDEPQPPPESSGVPEGWPNLLTGWSKPLDAGDYTVVDLGTALSFSIGEGWWAQANFPSFLVLSGDESFGPGDRGIVFRSGVDQLVPSVRSGGGGDGMPFDLTMLASSPPANVEILESEEIDLGGAQGLRVRLAFADTADCSVEVCEYMVTTRYPFPPSSLRTGYQYEIWHFDQSVSEPVTLIVAAPDPQWFAHARTVIETINFDIDS